jgi:transcriptional regulator with XRE-family HTH domain
MLKKEIGIRLRELRTARKESLRQLAEKIDITFSALQKIEAGDNYPSVEVIDKLSRHYDVEPSYFFGNRYEVPDKYNDQIKWMAFGDKMDKYNLSPHEVEKMLEGFLKIYGDKDK